MVDVVVGATVLVVVVGAVVVGAATVVGVARDVDVVEAACFVPVAHAARDGGERDHHDRAARAAGGAHRLCTRPRSAASASVRLTRATPPMASNACPSALASQPSKINDRSPASR